MHKGSSMIELVIAIVVMGIAVMSLPLILTQSQNSNALALQQEVIMATKTKVSYILAYEWDENSYDENASVSRVLDTTSSSDASDDFDVDANTTRRIGHIAADNRRRLRNIDDVDRNASVFSIDGANDIDDFHDTNESTTISATSASDMDYIFIVTRHTEVAYIKDTLALGFDNNDANITFSFDINTTSITGPTNIKMITVQTSNADNSVNTTLRAFASNIGESRISKRAW